jgi:hypothetical protein
MKHSSTTKHIQGNIINITEKQKRHDYKKKIYFMDKIQNNHIGRAKNEISTSVYNTKSSDEKSKFKTFSQKIH